MYKSIKAFRPSEGFSSASSAGGSLGYKEKSSGKMLRTENKIQLLF